MQTDIGQVVDPQSQVKVLGDLEAGAEIEGLIAGQLVQYDNLVDGLLGKLCAGVGGADKGIDPLGGLPGDLGVGLVLRPLGQSLALIAFSLEVGVVGAEVDIEVRSSLPVSSSPLVVAFSRLYQVRSVEFGNGLKVSMSSMSE